MMNHSIRRHLRVLCFLCVLAIEAGCGYSLAGRGSFLPGYVKTIGIPTFLNRTTVFNLETQLTQKVRAEFSLSALVYNLRRVLNLMGVADLLQALGVAVKNAVTSPV